jgi:hypothetical protein
MLILTIVIDESRKHIDIRTEPKPGATGYELALGRKFEELFKGSMVQAVRTTDPKGVQFG